jgi:hypothetical protein
MNDAVCYVLGLCAIFGALIYTLVETDCDRKPPSHPWLD